MKADSIIPLRQRKRKKVGGKYRKQLHLVFDKIKYNQRNMAETTFSVVKKKFGEILRARKFRNQVKEIKLKTHSVQHRQKSCRNNLHQFRGFLQSLNLTFF